MQPRIVLSLEQALSMPSATLRFAQLGWRVIRIEATPSGRGNPGDPNRYIGAKVIDEGGGRDDRRTYFLAPNVGKESIALDLKSAQGQEILHRLIRELDADIFCCNTLPGRYETFGIDYETLKSVKEDIIWAGISALGPDYPFTPGYDPAIQAMSGIMELTGFEDGPPTLSGIPLVDLKAGDEVFAGVCLALAERAETGKGKRIDVSMLQAAASWLITTLPLLDFDCGPEEVTRAGNEHRKFIPTNVYPASDGFIYIAIGNDSQWQRFTEIEKFAAVAGKGRATNEGRLAERFALYDEIGAVTQQYPLADLIADLQAARIPHAKINTVEQVRNLAAIEHKLTGTETPDGRTIRMQPMPIDVEGARTQLSFAPKYGEHTRSVLAQAGYSETEIDNFADSGVIAD